MTGHVLNIEHADFPEVGDVWHDHGMHVCTVQKVDGDQVTCRWANRDRPRVMARTQFAKFMRYDTMPTKTWAHVTPRDAA